MRLPGPTESFCLFDDARAHGTAPARLYRDPVGTIVARTIGEVQPALDRLVEAADRGLHVAGYLSYEAGLALEDRLVPIGRARDAGTEPLLWFGLLFVLSVYFFPAGIVGQLRLWAERRRERKAAHSAYQTRANTGEWETPA